MTTYYVHAYGGSTQARPEQGHFRVGGRPGRLCDIQGRSKRARALPAESVILSASKWLRPWTPTRLSGFVAFHRWHVIVSFTAKAKACR